MSLQHPKVVRYNDSVYHYNGNTYVNDDNKSDCIATSKMSVYLNNSGSAVVVSDETTNEINSG